MNLARSPCVSIVIANVLCAAFACRTCAVSMNFARSFRIGIAPSRQTALARRNCSAFTRSFFGIGTRIGTRTRIQIRTRIRIGIEIRTRIQIRTRIRIRIEIRTRIRTGIRIRIRIGSNLLSNIAGQI